MSTGELVEQGGPEGLVPQRFGVVGRARKIEAKIFPSKMSNTKGQLISKWFLGSSISSKKRTSEFDFTTYYAEYLGSPWVFFSFFGGN